MHQVLPDLIRQVAAGPSADPAADPAAVAEGTAGAAADPGAPAAAADEPPDAHQEAAQREQRAQHCADDDSYAPGVWGEKETSQAFCSLAVAWLTRSGKHRASVCKRIGDPGGLRALGHTVRNI